MKKMPLALERPILFSLLLMIFALIALYAPTVKLYSQFFDPQYAYFLAEISNKLVVSIILVLLLVRLSLMKSIGLTIFPKKSKDWLIAWPLFIILLIGVLPLLTKDIIIDQSKPGILAVFPLMNFLTGFSEELLIRGLLLSVLLLKWGNTKKGIVLCVIGSSLLFGSAHLGNLFINPSLLVATFSQIIYATLIGIFFAACVLRSQSIWPAIVLHAAIDFLGQIQQIAVGGGVEAATQASASVSLLQALQPIFLYMILASYAFFLLRKVTPITIKLRFLNQSTQNDSHESV